MAKLSDLVRRRSFGFAGPEGEMFDEQNNLSSLSRPPITNESIAAQRMPKNYIQRSGGEVIDLGPSWQNTTVNGMPAAISPNQQDMVIFAPNGQYQTTMAEQQAIAERRRQDAEIADLPRQMALAKLKEQQLKATAGGKLQFSESQGGFIEPPSAQYPQGRIIPLQGAQPKSKPLPAIALKLQQEELDAIGAASSLNKDLASFQNMIGKGKLPLGPVNNLGYKIRNMAGQSTEESRNYASFLANLERLRNESLRLNKGVQTEGDAIRAWNEIIANINDPELVMQRLGEVQKVNERGVLLRKMNVDAIRSNYGKDPMDVTGRENVQSAYETDDAQAIAWAQSNPNDPRAAQIMSLHGR